MVHAANRKIQALENEGKEAANMASDKIEALENEVIEGKEAVNMASNKIHALESQNQRQDEEIRLMQTQLAQSYNLHRSTGRLTSGKALKEN